MASDRAVVTCPACDLEEAFEKLQSARACIERHRRETGHDPAWDLAPLSSGVERAGEAAGVCGIPGSADDIVDGE
ncbi:DUF7542 family protein [Salinibaculum rarum]|uniref:DUF7542 family protein n=1 Tax=Salinibaculum rarum TaxID=3058903 RepID=UPI0026604B10|nr:hypothetical protein [Salinibaculum sp. KK48]